MRRSLRLLLLLAAALTLLTGRADAQHAGLRQTTIAHTAVALYYPSQTLARHCQQERAADPVFCRTGQPDQPRASATATVVQDAALADRRVRAVVALAPVGALFDPASLAAITVPVALYQADKDSWLVPRFHAGWLAGAMPSARLHRVPGAGHFAFMDTPGMAIATEDGDIRADPAGFDRTRFLARLATDLPAFFDQALR